MKMNYFNIFAHNGDGVLATVGVDNKKNLTPFIEAIMDDMDMEISKSDLSITEIPVIDYGNGKYSFKDFDFYATIDGTKYGFTVRKTWLYI